MCDAALVRPPAVTEGNAVDDRSGCAGSEASHVVRDDAQGGEAQGPHPLALRAAAALPAGARLLVLGAGSGRSLPPLAQRGLALDIAPADDEALTSHRGPFDGVLSTHALLHGTQAGIALRLAALAARLKPAGLFFATFGSSEDPRSGAGIWAPGGGWIPTEGAENGVTHAYFDRPQLERLLAEFEITRVERRDVRAVVGTWAHAKGAVQGPSVHWFVEARLAER